jgi:hypothetical protein
MSATFPFEPTVYLGKMPLPVAEAMRDALSDTDPTPMNEAAFAWLNAAIALADPGPQTCAECHRAFEEGDEMLFNFDGEYVHARSKPIVRPVACYDRAWERVHAGRVRHALADGR